jgi:DNA-binding NtrC family response regulator
MTLPRIIVADDQPDVLSALRLLLKSNEFDVTTIRSPAALIDAVRAEHFDAALVDLNYTRDTTSGQEGLDLLAQLQNIEHAPPVIVMTAWATIQIAVEAMRRGARDLIEKPWENHRLLSILRTQIAFSRESRRLQRLQVQNSLLTAPPGEEFVADSAAMKPVLETIERVAPSDAGVLITGENGTGKGIIARLIHQFSKRSDQSFVTVNMGGIAESVFESEMLGHVRGAFTDAKTDRIGRAELADGGTLFLDEVGNTPLNQQAKLLRLVESGEFERVGSSRTQITHLRIISATNADLSQLVSAGQFRQDLLFRLNTIEIRLPPLRARQEDIVPIAYRRLAFFAAKYARRLEGFDDGAVRALRGYSWPGNVRELGHVVERAVLMARGTTICEADLGLAAAPPAPDSFELMTLEESERRLIRAALRRANRNVNVAADALGLSRSALYRRLDKLGLRADGQ